MKDLEAPSVNIMPELPRWVSLQYAPTGLERKCILETMGARGKAVNAM